MRRRKWIKLYVDEILRGTTFKELDLEERAIWFELLLLAGDSPYEGEIAVAEGVGYTNEQLSALLAAPVEVVKRALNKLEKVGKIERLKSGSIKIVNWGKYQSPYTSSTERVRRWRQKKKAEEKEGQDVTRYVTRYSNTLQYKDLPLEEKRKLIMAAQERLLKELRKEYPVVIRLVPKTRIRFANILHSLAESEGSVGKAEEIFKKAWDVYYKTGRKGTGTWMKWINEKKFSFGYFLSVIQYFIDAVVAGQEILTDKKGKVNKVTKVSNDFEDFGNEPF